MKACIQANASAFCLKSVNIIINEANNSCDRRHFPEINLIADDVIERRSKWDRADGEGS
jgi:hypothetical protein